ncbi:hypothetical protein Tco_0963794 [Tanacetum coccineum]
MTYKKPPLIMIEKVEVTRYTVGPGESYTKVRVLWIDEMPRTEDNLTIVRAWLMKEIEEEGGDTSLLRIRLSRVHLFPSSLGV